MTTILLVDDHQIFLEAVQSLFEPLPEFQIVATADNGLSAIERARQHAPDIIIMDVSMPDLNGIDATRRILEIVPKTKIIALSMHTDKHFVLEMIKAGASGYLRKDDAFDELIRAIRVVSRGESYLSPKLSSVILKCLQGSSTKNNMEDLSPREKDVLKLLAAGKNTRQVGELLFISAKTVESHRSNIMKKLDLWNLADLTKYAIRNGLTGL